MADGKKKKVQEWRWSVRLSRSGGGGKGGRKKGKKKGSSPAMFFPGRERNSYRRRLPADVLMPKGKKRGGKDKGKKNGLHSHFFLGGGGRRKKGSLLQFSSALPLIMRARRNPQGGGVRDKGGRTRMQASSSTQQGGEKKKRNRRFIVFTTDLRRRISLVRSSGCPRRKKGQRRKLAASIAPSEGKKVRCDPWSRGGRKREPMEVNSFAWFSVQAKRKKKRNQSWRLVRTLSRMLSRRAAKGPFSRRPLRKGERRETRRIKSETPKTPRRTTVDLSSEEKGEMVSTPSLMALTRKDRKKGKDNLLLKAGDSLSPGPGPARGKRGKREKSLTT